MKDNFDECVEVILIKEGRDKYTNHPKDKGGPTKYGITLKTLSKWRNKRLIPSDVKALTESEAILIYHSWYWKPVRGDDLPKGLDLMVFDFAVNVGAERSVMTLQEILNVKRDGIIGPNTLAAIEARNVNELIEDMATSRMDYYKTCEDWKTFGKGWTNRVNSIKSLAFTMVDDPIELKPDEPLKSSWLDLLGKYWRKV